MAPILRSLVGPVPCASLFNYQLFTPLDTTKQSVPSIARQKIHIQPSPKPALSWEGIDLGRGSHGVINIVLSEMANECGRLSLGTYRIVSLCYFPTLLYSNPNPNILLSMRLRYLKIHDIDDRYHLCV